MKKSTIKYQNKQELHKRISRVLDFTPDVKIRKLENGAVQVNNYHIKNVHGEWKCSDKKFYRRKSAVGYALCLLRNDSTTAREIKELDRFLLKIKTDIDIYYYHMRKAKNGRQITMSNRISSDMPRLHQVDAQLTQLLKTISV
tara:strand:- start:189 stop:617 length:429 start_codon:yes stop_codon:yes gene_type:complete